jgi:RNA polymerase sigma-70 factor (ECF subfamily)
VTLLEGGPAPGAPDCKTPGIDDATSAGAGGGASDLAGSERLAGLADDGFVECYQRHYPRLVRALELSGASRAAAEDVAQEAFARTFVHWRRVRHGTNPPGYVYRVAFRLARRAHRLPVEDALPSDEHVAPAHGHGDVAEEATLRTSATAAIAAMPSARRACAVLCLLAGVSTRDAARALRIKESTVRKQIERARSDLRRAVAYEVTTPLGQETPVPPSVQ